MDSEIRGRDIEVEALVRPAGSSFPVGPAPVSTTTVVSLPPWCPPGGVPAYFFSFELLEVPPPTVCEVNVAPRPKNCVECIAGIFVCAAHEKFCVVNLSSAALFVCAVFVYVTCTVRVTLPYNDAAKWHWRSLKEKLPVHLVVSLSWMV